MTTTNDLNEYSTIANWKLACQTFLHGTAPSRRVLDWLEQNVTNVFSLTTWMKHRYRATADPCGDLPEIEQIMHLRVKHTPVWEELVQNGFQYVVEQRRTDDEQRPQVLRAIAAILHDPDLLSDFEAELFTRETLPDWTRKARSAMKKSGLIGAVDPNERQKGDGVAKLPQRTRRNTQ